MNFPKLRFKEFNDEYFSYKLKDKCEIYDGTHETPKYTNNGVKFVSVEDIKNLLNSNKYISKDDFEKYKIKPRINDIFMTRIGDIGTSAILNKEIPLAYYVSLSLIRCKNKTLNASYLNQYISCYRFQKELNNRTIHVAFPKKINTGEIGESNIIIPNDIKEQTKIANFLSLLDKKIELQTKKIEDLKLYKLSQMEDTFNRQCLETKSFEDVAIINKGTQLNSEELLDGGNYYMLNGGISPSGNTNKYNCNANTITISEGGNSCGYVNFNKSKFWCGGHCYFIVPKDVNNLYLYQNLKYNENRIMTLRVGSGLPNIQKRDLEKFKLKIHNDEDQVKVAKYLLLYDEKVDLEISKLKKLKEFKKGLMQNMFV